MQTESTPSKSDKLKALREGIKNKYELYHSRSSDLFPIIEYNTSRANYEPLRESFEKEFYEVRGINRLYNHLHIPSTNTLALIFSNDDYMPGKRILDTCLSYAETSLKVVPGLDALPGSLPEAAPIRRSRRWPFMGLILLTGICAVALIEHFQMPSSAYGLTITSPHTNQTVPMKLRIEGTAINADAVWPVVCAVGDTGYNSPAYYVQDQIPVQSWSGRWRGYIQIGGRNRKHIGAVGLIRVFANPESVLVAGQRLNMWPRAKLSSAAVQVIRGYYPSDFASSLTITQPLDRRITPNRIIIEGQAPSADIVWTIVRPVLKNVFYVQPPARVDKDGHWHVPVYISGADRTSAGKKYQIRAFVNPDIDLKAGDKLHAWPKAELTTEAIDVIRGNEQ